ncbi:MAG TPA: formate dehydrogenase accessory sulfurtransferase FdhD [Steroidobacteraceae bacterium]|jgi:FdhD protein|nr:formate dehydrogenase accessory sulfurtransferase FdhD [Steroidobacteraceae bacterium]
MQPREISALVMGPAGRAALPVPDAPRVSASQVPLLRQIAAVDESGAARALFLPVERPLTIALDGRELVTLMTLGGAPEWLVLGYLHNQRLIDEAAALESIEVDWTECCARVTSRRRASPASANAGRGAGAGPGAGATPLGCALGTVFRGAMRGAEGAQVLDAAGNAAGGAAAGAAAARAAAGTSARVSHTQILAILETMRRHDAIHQAAGGVHSGALFQGDELWAAVEDVSRHNGIDTITGFMALHGIAGADKILFSTGRLTGEMVMKAAHNGVPVMISRNGTTAMGYELAARLGMTLIGRAANRRYVCYIGAERIDADHIGTD